MYDTRNRLYARSYPQLGTISSFGRVAEMVTEEFGSLHPCLPWGLSYSWTNPFSQKTYTFMGTENGGGKAELCAHLVVQIMDLNRNSPFPKSATGQSECHAYGIYAPPIYKEMTFIAIDGFWDIVQAMKSPQNKIMDMSIAELANLMTSTCMLTWKQLQEKFADVDEEMLKQACFLTTFVYHLLTLGFGFTLEQETPIRFAKGLEGSRGHARPVGWATGLMVWRVDHLPYDKGTTPSRRNAEMDASVSSPVGMFSDSHAIDDKVIIPTLSNPEIAPADAISVAS